MYVRRIITGQRKMFAVPNSIAPQNVRPSRKCRPEGLASPSIGREPPVIGWKWSQDCKKDNHPGSLTFNGDRVKITRMNGEK
jgi:hypothetical protein